MDGSIIANIRHELRALFDQKRAMERKIEALQSTLATYKVDINEDSQSSSPRVRGGIDLRPIIVSIFSKNRNKPLRVREIVREIEELAPEIPHRAIEKKMIYAVRPKAGLLQKIGYGKYRLSEEQADAGAPLNRAAG